MRGLNCGGTEALEGTAHRANAMKTASKLCLAEKILVRDLVDREAQTDRVVVHTRQRSKIIERCTGSRDHPYLAESFTRGIWDDTLTTCDAGMPEPNTTGCSRKFERVWLHPTEVNPTRLRTNHRFSFSDQVRERHRASRRRQGSVDACPPLREAAASAPQYAVTLHGEQLRRGKIGELDGREICGVDIVHVTMMVG